MKTNITHFDNDSLCNPVASTIREMQKMYNCFVFLYRNDETDHHFINVLTLDCRHWDDVFVSEKDSGSKIAVGIRKWFNEHGNEVKGG